MNVKAYNVELAKAIGLKNAIILQLLVDIQTISGEEMIKISISGLEIACGVFTNMQIRGAMKTLEDYNYINSAKSSTWDKTKCYFLTNKTKEVFKIPIGENNKSIVRKQQIDCAKITNRLCENNKSVKSTPEVDFSENTTQNCVKSEVEKTKKRHVLYIHDNIDNNNNNNKLSEIEKMLISKGIEKTIISDFLNVRKKKKAVDSITAARGIERELSKLAMFGFDLNIALEEAITRNWTTVKFDWLQSDNKEKTTQNNKIQNVTPL